MLLDLRLSESVSISSKLKNLHNLRVSEYDGKSSVCYSKDYVN